MKPIYLLSLLLFILCTGCANKKKDWFVVEKLDSRTFVISEPNSSQGNSSFLIIGDNEAILFDSGSGENTQENVIHVAESLTHSRLTLLLSHFHFDHIGNVDKFRRIGIPDLSFLKNRLTIDSIIHLSHKDILSKNTKSIKVARLFPIGKEIDLGNRRITILHTPGHANESISIVDNENGYVFTGDLIYNGLLLIENCREYEESINAILKNSDSNYRVFGSHGKPEVDYKQLQQIKDAVKWYQTNNCAPKSTQQIKLFGTIKDVHKVGDISFIVGYTDSFVVE